MYGGKLRTIPEPNALNPNPNMEAHIPGTRSSFACVHMLKICMFLYVHEDMFITIETHPFEKP